MELRQLSYLIAVVEEANFTRAADRMHIAQPGVSAQIRGLERELGQQLLDRTTRTVRPTQAGAAFLPYARAALAAVEGGREALDELAGLRRGHLTIGTPASISAIDLPSVLADYNRDYPAVVITLAVADTNRLVAGVRDGRYDVILVGLTGPFPPGTDTHTIIDEPLVAVISRTHSLSTADQVPIRALAGCPLISLPTGTGLRKCLDDVCASAGFAPDIAFEAADPRVLVDLAAHGLGIAIVPRSVVVARQLNVHVLALTDPEPRARIVLGWRTDPPPTPAAHELIRRVTRQA